MASYLNSATSRDDVRLDISDVYLFRGEWGTVFVMNVCNSLAAQEVQGFHPEGMYEFKIDGDRDAVEAHPGAEAADPHAPGVLLAEGSTESTVESEDGSWLWAGQAGDPFWVDPDVLHAVGAAFQHGTIVDLAGWDRRAAKNLFADQTCARWCWRCRTQCFYVSRCAGGGSVSGG